MQLADLSMSAGGLSALASFAFDFYETDNESNSFFSGFVSWNGASLTVSGDFSMGDFLIDGSSVSMTDFLFSLT